MQEEESSQTINYTELSKDSKLQLLLKRHQLLKIQHQPEEQPEQCRQYTNPASPSQSQIHRGYNSDYVPDELHRRKEGYRKRTHIINKKQKTKSRKRTRMYIEMLENRVNQLQTEIDRMRKLNKINQEYINRLRGADRLIDGFFIGRQQIFEKLEHLNQAQQQKEMEEQQNNKKVLEILQNLRIRQGVYGKDRIKAVNYYFKEMVQLLLPQIQKYIIKTAMEETDLFDKRYIQTGVHKDEEQVEKWRKKILEEIDLSSQSKSRFYSLRESILSEAHQFKQLIRQFYHLKCKLIQKARNLERVSDNAHHEVNPRKLSKVLCYIDKYKYEKNISLENIFSEILKENPKEEYNYNRKELFIGSKQVK